MPAGEVSDSNALSSALPSVIRGVVTNESGRPVAGATVSFNTWPNRAGDPKKDLKLSPVVLAQSRSDANGNFQMTIDEGLQDRLIMAASFSGQVEAGEANAALVVVAKKMGVVQVLLKEMSDPSNLEIQLAREMIVRGNISLDAASGMDGMSADSQFELMIDADVRVYDVKTINQIVAGLQEGVSLEELSQKHEPLSVLDPVAGGVPRVWTLSSSGAFIVRNIPINAIFEVHAIGKSGVQQKTMVISRPIRGFEFKPSKTSTDKMLLQGSRIKMGLKPTVVEE